MRRPAQQDGRVDARSPALRGLAAGAAQGWHGDWCPRTSDFLNWRYLQHPVHRYVGFAVGRDAVVLGYGVLRVEDARALLMEFVVDPAAPAARRVLLRRLLAAARAAGCASLRVMAPAHWAHWRFMRSVGAVGRRAGPLLQVLGPDAPELRVMGNWLLSPGDVDAL